jgi:Domain of unknown function (DUF1707)
MVTGRGDQMAAGATGRGHFRASDADREQVVDTLKDAFVAGRLTKDEFGVRTGQALTSRTYAELTAATADIPALLMRAQPPLKPGPAHARKPMNKKVVAWAAGAIILPPALGAAFLTYYGGFIVMFLLAFAGLTVTSAPCSGARLGSTKP